ncbi:P-loop containing nucleoside triphosphate hydrolase protein, partial [Coniochaeta sp. 2T2.1]
MPSASSPIAYPSSPSSPRAKRPYDQDTTKPRVTAGFLDDDSDDDENMTDSLPALPKLPDLPKPKPRTTAGFLDDSDDDDVTDKPPLKRRALDDAFSKDSVPPPSTNPVTCSGKSASVPMRKTTTNVSYQSMVADRSKTKEGRAKRSYYGIDIHELVTGANKELAAAKQATPITPPANPDQPVRSVEEHGHRKKSKKCLLWTEKYRARNFADLVGDDLTNRQVLRWLKRWDPVVFPHEEKPLRKILMLTGPPGLGKTTLAHVCARQAGYEVLEINASDDRSSAVVKGRIRTSLGTESVKTVEHNKPEAGKQAKVARPVCVVVDEVDGVKNSTGVTSHKRNKKKGDDFRQMRPLILICNDVYAPSLRPLRQSGLAEVIHCGKPSMDAVVSRLKSVGIDAKRGAEGNVEGDLRGIMVVGEMEHGLGRGGSKEIVGRVFKKAPVSLSRPRPLVVQETRHEQPQTELSFAEQQKKYGALRLAEMVETCGEIDRIVTDPDTAYEWLHFHDTCSTRLFAGQEWELGRTSASPCWRAITSLPRSSDTCPPSRIDSGAIRGESAPPVPFSGPRADFEAREAEKVNRAMLQGIQAALPPNKWPVASVRRDSERTMVKRAANVLAEVGIQLIKGKIEAEGGGLVGRPTG